LRSKRIFNVKSSWSRCLVEGGSIDALDGQHAVEPYLSARQNDMLYGFFFDYAGSVQEIIGELT
jgi:hypothetical protein